MATQNATNYALAADPTGANQLAPGSWHGRVRVQSDSFTFAGEAAGEVINIAKLPLGALVLAIGVVTDGLGGAVTLDVGDGNTGDLYLDGIATTANTMVFGNETPGYAIDAASKQTITVTTADAAATGTMKTIVLYSAD